MRSLVLILAAGLSFAQQTTAPPSSNGDPKAELKYSGQPLEIKPTCRPEEISAIGLTCTQDEPCPMFLELTDAELVGTRVFVVGNLHSTAATLETVLLASEDGGRTWTEAASRIPSAGLDQIQFIDFEHGWISGQTLAALPRDAFFLISADGGKTWRRRPVFSELRVGSIESFFFESKSAGTMSIDRLQSADNGMRYELYETMTGGDSWSLRQVAPKPIAAKRRPTDRPVRLRTDSATKSYRLEKNTAANWETLAAFRVEAGECKGAEPAPLTEPADREQPSEAAPAPEAPSKPKRRR